MKTKPPSKRKAQLAFGSAILALLVVGAISLRGIAVWHESEEWVRHTHEVLEHLQSMLIAMQGVESSARGFILTGKESYLQTYRADILSSTQEEIIVRDLTADNPNQQRRFPELERLATQKIAFNDNLIAARRAKGLDAAVVLVQKGAGQQIMDDYRELIHEMEDEELRLLALRNADAARRLKQTRTFLLLGTVLGALIASAAALGAQRDHRARVVAKGVETQAELAFLVAHQCDEAQGYFFSRPLPPEKFAELLKSGIRQTVLK